MKKLLFGATVVLAATPAAAFDSLCYVYPDTSLQPAEYARLTPGPTCDYGYAAARNRWIGPLDEHRQLWEQTMVRAGLPASLSETVSLRVFNNRDTVSTLTPSADFDSLTPVDFARAERVHTRSFSIGEFAQLPDFSYALWDWATGNESCPIPGLTIATNSACHNFETHMGAVNSNHFAPQAGAFYRYYHNLALDRARVCGTLAGRLTAAGHRYDDYLRACETEALTLEAVGHHFLQDSWSMGHMWERWGSPDLGDFPGATDIPFNAIRGQQLRAITVAAMSGLIHGARALIDRPEARARGVTGFDDPLCAPVTPSTYAAGDADPLFVTLPSPRYVSGGGTLVNGLGDLYLPLLATGAFAGQRTGLYDCATAGAIAVYCATSMAHGRYAACDASRPDPTSEACLGQRATNSSMYVGLGIDYAIGARQFHIRLDPRIASRIAMNFGFSIPSVLPSGLSALLSVNLARTAWRTFRNARDMPDGTETARGGTGPMLDVNPNGAYVHGTTPLATYIDPPLPWTGTAGDAARSTVLARTFHRAHAFELCNAVRAADLTALRTHASDTSLDATTHAAACEACSEIAVRHMRYGSDATHYDRSAEPLCDLLTEHRADVVYQPPRDSGDAHATARAWCGCSEALAVTDGGVARFRFTAGAVTRLPVAGNPTGLIPVGSGPGSIAVLGAGVPRALVANYTEGTLSVLSLETGAEREIDTDRNLATTSMGAGTGITRIPIGAGARGLAVTPGGDYALVGTATEEVVVVDLRNYTVCKRFAVGSDAALAETVEGLAITRDGRKAYVALTGPSLDAGHSVAVIDMERALDCETAGGEVRSRTLDLGGSSRPGVLSLSPDGAYLAVAGRGSNRVIVLDTTTDAIYDVDPSPAYRLFTAGYSPLSLAWTSDSARVYHGALRGLDGTALTGAGVVGYGAINVGPSVYVVGAASAVVGLALSDDNAWAYAADSRGNISALRTTLWDPAPGTVTRPADGTGGCLDARYVAIACPTTYSIGARIRTLLRF